MSEQLLREYIAESLQVADEGFISDTIKTGKQAVAAGDRLGGALLSGNISAAFEELVNIVDLAKPGAKAALKKAYYGNTAKEYRTELSKKIANDLEKNEDEIRELTEKLDSGKLPDEKKKEAISKRKELREQRKKMEELVRQISYLQDDAEKLDRLANKFREDMELPKFETSDLRRVAIEVKDLELEKFGGNDKKVRDAVKAALEASNEVLYDALKADLATKQRYRIKNELDATDRLYIAHRLKKIRLV